LAADISALRRASIKLRSRESVLVDFEGPDVDVDWSCEYADGEFSGLDYDSWRLKNESVPDVPEVPMVPDVQANARRPS